MKTQSLFFLWIFGVIMFVQGFPMDVVKPGEENARGKEKTPAEITAEERRNQKSDNDAGREDGNFSEQEKLIEEQGSTSLESWTGSRSSIEIQNEIHFELDWEVPSQQQELMSKEAEYREKSKEAKQLHNQDDAERYNQSADWLCEAHTIWLLELHNHKLEQANAEQEKKSDLATALIELSAREEMIVIALIESAKDLAEKKKNWKELEDELQVQRDYILILKKNDEQEEVSVPKLEVGKFPMSPFIKNFFQWSLQPESKYGIHPPSQRLSTQAKGSVQVAIIDTEIDYAHRNLVNRFSKNRLNFNNHLPLAKSKNSSDEWGHGTHVAGIIADVSESSGSAVFGNNPNIEGIKLIDYKVVTQYGKVATSEVIHAIHASFHQGADIINLGFSAEALFSTSGLIRELVRQQIKNSIFIIPAGNNSDATGAIKNNDRDSLGNSLSEVPGVVVVAATGRNGDLMESSNYGHSSVHLVAPGDDIFSTLPNNHYGFASGTSMAAAHVSGALALMKSCFSELTSQQLLQALFMGCDKDPRLEGKVKYGRLNLTRSLQLCDFQKEKYRDDPQASYTAASALEEQALKSLCQEAIPLWEEAIQKMQDARKSYENLKEQGIAFDEEQEDACKRTLAKLAWYEAQKSDCISRVAQDRAMDAPAYTKQQVDGWEDAVQEAAKAEQEWLKAEEIYKKCLQETPESTKDWWSKEYDVVVREKNNAIGDLNWCKDRKEALVLSPFECPSEQEYKRLRASEVVEAAIVDGPKQNQQTQVRILKTDLDLSLIRKEEVFDLASKVVLNKKEMAANCLLLTLKKGANVESISKRLELDPNSIQKPTSAYSSFHRLYLKEPFLQSWAEVIKKVDHDKKLPVAQQKFAMIERVEPDSFCLLRSSKTDPIPINNLSAEQNADLFHKDQWNFKGEGEGIDVLHAWKIRDDAEPIIVAVIDSGIHFEHTDFKRKDGSPKNIWSNNELTQGQYGWNAFNNTRRPSDDYGHGTHVAGIIGASKNSDQSIAGIVKTIQLMPCKGLNAQGEDGVSSGLQSAIVECINYALKHGAKILNLSLGSTSAMPAVLEALKRTQNKNIIVIAAAGNEGQKIDEHHHDYPATWVNQYDLKNVVIVAATSNNTKNLRDGLYKKSDYGKQTVHLAAPGDNILSTWHGKKNMRWNHPKDSSGNDNIYYCYLSGTSQAVPHVSAALALMMKEFPYLSPQDLIDRLKITVERNAALKTKLIWEGSLNLARALGHLDAIAPHALKQWIQRLLGEARTANRWMNEVARNVWNSVDEKLWQKATSRIDYAQRAWQKVGEACQRGMQLFPNNQEEETKIDGLPNKQNENEWQQTLRKAQENQNAWEARKFLHEAQQAKNIFLHSATDSTADRLRKLRNAEQTWSKVLEVYSDNLQKASEQFQQFWFNELGKLIEWTPDWNQETLNIK